MQQYSLIGLGEIEGVTDLCGGPTLHIAETDHGSLRGGRQRLDRRFDHAERLAGEESLGGQGAPAVRWGSPVAHLEAPGVDRRSLRVLECGKRKRPPLALPACLG